MVESSALLRGPSTSLRSARDDGRHAINPRAAKSFQYARNLEGQYQFWPRQYFDRSLPGDEKRRAEVSSPSQKGFESRELQAGRGKGLAGKFRGTRSSKASSTKKGKFIVLNEKDFQRVEGEASREESGVITFPTRH